jgi:hypothetical protein
MLRQAWVVLLFMPVGVVPSCLGNLTNRSYVTQLFYDAFKTWLAPEGGKGE